MTLRTDALVTTLALAALVAAGQADAQSLSSEEMQKRFQAHRGLTLAPTAPATEQNAPRANTSTASTAQPQGSATSGGSGSSGASTAAVATTTTTLTPAARPAARPATAATPSGITDDEAKAIAASYTALPDDLRVDIQVNFEFDSAVLLGSERAKLDTVCGAMKGAEVEVFHIFGHTDASGSASYNLTLSQLRADEVRRYLISSCGMAPTRLKAIGVGEEHLIDSSSPRAPANRRVEFQAVG